MIEHNIVYKFAHRIYFSIKDISLGIMIASNKNLIYGLKGREYFIELNLLFLHIKCGIVRCGHER